mmetsp:Transcript_14933/g.39978  ORF Transcript_14933/g.39978 Transcript_14933/m.39978 type:complete len:85 (+) Transcript_14933:61-315(+)
MMAVDGAGGDMMPVDDCRRRDDGGQSSERCYALYAAAAAAPLRARGRRTVSRCNAGVVGAGTYDAGRIAAAIHLATPPTYGGVG